MNTWFQDAGTYLTSLLLVLVTAAAATTPRLPNWSVRAYLFSELAATVVLEAARHWPIAFDSDFYRVLYCLLLLPVRVLACVVAWKQSRRMVLATLPFAAMLLYLSIRGVSSAPSVDQWICLIDGVVVTSAGLGLAFTAAFSEHRSVYATLTILWMLLGLFDFGYVLQPYGKWAALNDSLLPVMVIGAFGWIAFKQNIQRETRERKAGYYA